MLKNFFKTAGRNIIKYKAYSLINFVGLTAGIALALLIMTYVRSELGYDTSMKRSTGYTGSNTWLPMDFSSPPARHLWHP